MACAQEQQLRRWPLARLLHRLFCRRLWVQEELLQLLCQLQCRRRQVERLAARKLGELPQLTCLLSLECRHRLSMRLPCLRLLGLAQLLQQCASERAGELRARVLAEASKAACFPGFVGKTCVRAVSGRVDHRAPARPAGRAAAGFGHPA